MVKCRICNKEYQYISNTHLAREDHGYITQEKYKKKFPSAELYSNSLKKKRGSSWKGDKNPNIGNFGEDNHSFGKDRGSSWNSGLTKDTDERVAKTAKKLSKIYGDGRLAGENHPFFGKHHKKSTKKLLSNSKEKQWKDPALARKFLSGRNRKPNGEEKSFMLLLRSISPGKFKLNVKGQVARKYKLDVDGLTPDFIWLKAKKIILYNGCDWHCCPRCKGKHPKGNSSKAVISNNQKVLRRLKSKGWKVLTVWSHEWRDINKLSNKVLVFIEK